MMKSNSKFHSVGVCSPGSTVIVECASGAPLLSKFGNLLIREILVVTSGYAPPYRLRGRGKGVPRQPDGGGGWRMPSFLGGKSPDHRRFCKRGFFKA